MATNKKKRTALDVFLTGVDEINGQTIADTPKLQSKKTDEANVHAQENNVNQLQSVSGSTTSNEKAKHEISKYMLYLPLPVSEQLRALHFEEQRGQVKKNKLHDHILEAIDLLFKDRGLKSIEELLND